MKLTRLSAAAAACAAATGRSSSLGTYEDAGEKQSYVERRSMHHSRWMLLSIDFRCSIDRTMQHSQ